ncbi:hypothetical protein Tco_0638556 [Tanacetum coccineum]
MPVAATRSKPAEKILIDKMEANKSIDRLDIQKNLYKALVDAYDDDKDILDAYGDTITIKQRRDDADDDEEPSAGSNQGSKRRRAGKEPESTSAPKEKTSKTYLEEPANHEFETGGTEDQPDEETSQHPDWFQKPAKLPTPDRDWNKTFPAAHGHIMGTLNGLKIWSPTECGVKCWEFARDVYSKRRIIRRDDEKLYKFKEGDFNRLRIQDIEDMLLLLVQGKLTNLTIEERLAFNVSLRMFTRSVVIQRRVEDLQFLCRLKGIRMQYLPQTIWRQRDKDNAEAMIQAIDKQLKTRRIMRSLEKFVGGRPYEVMDPVTIFLLKLNLPDHRILKDGGEEFQEDQIKAFKSTIKKGMSMSVQKSQVHKMAKVTRWRKRDYAWLMISRCSRSHSRQAEEQAQDLKSMITTSNHKLMIEVKRAQD